MTTTAAGITAISTITAKLSLKWKKVMQL